MNCLMLGFRTESLATFIANYVIGYRMVGQLEVCRNLLFPSRSILYVELRYVVKNIASVY